MNSKWNCRFFCGIEKGRAKSFVDGKKLKMSTYKIAITFVLPNVYFICVWVFFLFFVFAHVHVHFISIHNFCFSLGFSLRMKFMYIFVCNIQISCHRQKLCVFKTFALSLSVSMRRYLALRGQSNDQCTWWHYDKKRFSPNEDRLNGIESQLVDYTSY